MCGSAGFLPEPRPRAPTSRLVSTPSGLGCPASCRSPPGAQHPRLQRLAPRHGARFGAGKKSCKVPGGVGRYEEERRKRRTRLSSCSDRGVRGRLSRSSPLQLDASPSAPDSAGGNDELVLRAVAAGLIVCSNSPEPGVGGLDSVHWDLPRVPAAAVAAAETPFVLPGLRSLSSVAAVGWL